MITLSLAEVYCADRDKAEYYSTIISDNSHYPKKQWHVFQHVFDKGHHQSEKSLASFLNQKSKGLMTCSQLLP